MRCPGCGDISTHQPVLEHEGTPNDLCTDCEEFAPESRRDDDPPVSEAYDLSSEWDDFDPFEE